MEKMSVGRAIGLLSGGIVLFVVLTVVAFLGTKAAPKQTAAQFFTPAQHAILFGQPPFDPQNPNPSFRVNPQQTQDLKNWGFNDCVAIDGTVAQKKGDGACFCENAPAVKAIFDGAWAVQPWNTLSTISLSAVGFLILLFVLFANPPQQSNFMTVTYFFAIGYAYMTIILGPLSMMLHVGLSSMGGWADSLSLYIWFGFVAVYGWYRFVVALTRTSPGECPGWSYWIFLGAWAIAIAVPALTTLPGHGNSEVWYGILGGIALLGEFFLWLGNKAGFATSPATSSVPSGADHWYSNLPWDTGGRVWFAAGGITFLVALVIWVLSFTKMPLCFPHSIQGHAIFHTLSAFAAGFLYKYYRHEGEA